jgi:hypothetical protein
MTKVKQHPGVETTKKAGTFVPAEKLAGTYSRGANRTTTIGKTVFDGRR